VSAAATTGRHDPDDDSAPATRYSTPAAVKYYKPRVPRVLDDVRASIGLIVPELAVPNRSRGSRVSFEDSDVDEFVRMIGTLDTGTKNLEEEQRELLKISNLYDQVLK
jgi:hypothetical protein